MKKLIINEAQFISLFDTQQNKEDKTYREKMAGIYLMANGNNQKEMLHKLAFQTTMKMIDNDEKLPEFGDHKIYHSVYDKRFSPKQVEYVEKNIIYPHYGNMSPEELAYVMAGNTIQARKDDNRRCKEAVLRLYNKGFFDEYLNGMVKSLALWDMGKIEDVTDFLGWLYSKNPFIKKSNINIIYNELRNRMDDIADSDDAFMENDIFLAFSELTRALEKLSTTPNKRGR